MNIFYLHQDPVKAAEYQYNKHVVKMILESAQMLCTAHHCIMGADADVPYKPAHRNHPSTKWARQSGENYTWLYRHMMELGREYEKRYGKKHLSIIKCEDPLSILPGGLCDNGHQHFSMLKCFLPYRFVYSLPKAIMWSYSHM